MLEYLGAETLSVKPRLRSWT